MKEKYIYLFDNDWMEYLKYVSYSSKRKLKLVKNRLLGRDMIQHLKLIKICFSSLEGDT